MAQLLPHEETSRTLLPGLISRMRQDAVQRDPLIIDKESKVVLDGMHRLQALKELGVAGAACNLIRYEDEGVRLMRWSRCVPSPGSRLLSRLTNELEMRERVTVPEAMKLLDSGGVASSLVLNGAAFLRAPEPSEGAAAESVRGFDRIVVEEGARVAFVDELSLGDVLRARDKAVLLTAKLVKKQVTEAAKKSRLFPHKTTMHILELRPVGLNVSLSKLREGVNTPDLERILRERVRKIVEPPAKYMGRTYGERLVVLS